ncbi:hypothetical protein N7474_001981 [Penicillium riverlandense]|uniref:uncharacterized protein n=1 Tax=Penicillium riverlandense TaxID=1903569 RepID=UPI002548E5F6|nr:uncharacterized protein N7474_001981 [Penicillium riverlandense]KAJ5833670.1 hypothetical protein N7474_001981 [Penicillium riverlandense]
MQTTTDDSVIGGTVIDNPPAPKTPGSPTRRKRSISVEFVSDRPSKQRAVLQEVPSMPDAIEKPSTDFQPCPFTNEFFGDVAHTIANTFPFESFARAQNCSLQDVAHAISAVVLAPLRWPHLLLEGSLQSCVTVDTPGRTQASDGTREWANEPNLKPLGSGTPRSPVIRTEVKIDIWGDYIPVEKCSDDSR